MLLSYWLRLVCLVFFSVGSLQIALSLLLRIQAPALNLLLRRLGARWQERVAFGVAIAPYIAALALAALVVAPQYIRNEANLLEEHVGILCLCGASLVALRYAYAMMRALRLVRGMLKRRPGIDVSIAGVPVRLVESEYPLLAIEGLLASRIVASRHLFDPTILGSDARRLALAHEIAHARHADNLKLFLLLSLSLPLCAGVALHRWRRAAEIAADGDATGRRRPHKILLAQTLLAMARPTPDRPQPVLFLTLLAHEADLEMRIRFLLQEPASTARNWRLVPLGAGLLIFGAANLLLPLAVLHSPEFAEHVLHF